MSEHITQPLHTEQNFPIVGIGASAGGLDAFKRLLRHINPNSGMAYILVQHLSPTHDSLLVEILTPETVLPIYQVEDDINIAPDTIYIIPENKILTTMDGVLKLSDRDAGKRNMPIDIFFNSLADVHKSFARGVILTGTGFDGTEGLKTIKENGGITFVQNPDSADFDGMPLSAVKAGAADFVLEVEEIPDSLSHINHAYDTSRSYSDDDHLVSKAEEDIFKQIIRLLRLRTGNDFSHYKQPTIRRRIARRMVITKREEPSAYLTFLRNDRQEQDALFNDILIPVSYFFRDSKIFNSLCDTIFTNILPKKVPDESIRVWVAGCSTGEEAYSIAICLHEYLSDKLPDIKVQVFASDISENVISKARTGVYSKQELQNVSEKRLNTYFTKIDGAYIINKEIRDMCIFAVHNFVKDPPFAKMDLITCRNVLIYLDPFLQKKALTTFHYALRPYGCLFLGKSESVSHVSNLFEPIVKQHKIYSRKSSTSTFLPTFDRTENVSTERQVFTVKKATIEPDFHKIASDILFTKYTPPGVIINEQREIVHFHGDTSPFLLQPPGKPNFGIFKMVREGLAFELRNALLKVKGAKDPIIKENIQLKGKEYTVNVEVMPLDNSAKPHILVLFHKNNIVADIDGNMANRNDADLERIKLLEEEIEQMREDIRRVTEDQEAANEELQSANEELLSNSEELQTLNEELETSAEELQSNNEELVTVNDELMDRQEQLTISRMYSEAIVETIREPLLVLDRELRVKSANASFYKYFNATEQDIEGRLIFEIGSAQWNIGILKEQLNYVLIKKEKLENFEITAVFPEIGERIIVINVRPIVNDNLSEHLLLFAIEDITDIRAADILLHQNNRHLEENNRELTSFSYIASHDLQEPLRKIHTFSKMIMDSEKDGLSDNTKTYLDRIMVSTKRMQQLINDLLNYSRINNIEDINFEYTDITYIIDDTKGELRENIENKNAIITVAKMPVLKVLPPLITQVFINLIGNALKYSKAGVPPLINISCEIVLGKGLKFFESDPTLSYCKISIADNGIGFSQEHASHIFEPFQRLHAKDKYEGTGIGLAICKKIMLKHKGYITAQSALGEGSLFNLYLPS
ncbi:CheR family methyltransferase [Flavobacterium rivuli]|uniref:CheR family methyltransferase n=1 Tax=Flavobacterium rivuli TaxID=498301 RepID=UPI0003781582|nr:CheR family methyltransferase [Flavobacterium rivuli]